MGRVLWRVYLAVGVAALSGYLLLPSGVVQDVVYVALGASCVAGISFGVRLHRPATRLPWLLMASGQLLWVIGDAVDSWQQDVQHVERFPSIADALYLAAYPVLGLALLLLIRGRRPRHDVAGLLDSATLTAGLGVLSWMLLARPTIEVSQHSLASATVGVAYPVADILLVGLLIRLVMTPGGRTPAFRLLLGAVLLLIGGDTATTALGLWSATTTNELELVWLASYVLWGAAALHPSMASLSKPGMSVDRRFSRWRLAALTSASLIAPATLVFQRLNRSTIDVWPVACGSVVLSLLVVARMNVGMKQIMTTNRDRERLQTNLAHQAAHDSLTGLPNRAQALEVIESALNRAQRSGALVGLLFIDLDGFKAVNDRFGHGAGDDVLRTVAQRLKVGVRGGDVVARLGGDEFIVLLEALTTESEALNVAARLVDALAEPIPVPVPVSGAHHALIGASVGMAISQDGSTDASRLLHEADAAVYRAKAAGRGRVEVFDDALRAELSTRSELEAALTHAIACDELVLHYQPIYDLPTGEVTGFEALVRWQRPGHGLLAPGAFVPAAEESDLICELDSWALHRATRQLAEWTRTGEQLLTMAVNISGRHISAPRIVADVRSALKLSGIRADQLVLEITETVLIEDLLAIHHLHELRALGVAISIDDFGTGYSSIARLQHLPVDIIKIDRSFLDTSDASSRALLELMIHAAHAFGLPVVVEGVEHKHQLATLRSMNCESVQGFYLSRPLTAEQVGQRKHLAAALD